MRGDRLLVEWLVGTAVLVALAIYAGHTAPERREIGRNRVDAAVFDALLPLAGTATAPEPLLVAIDDPSLDQIGQWPWPRTVHASIIDALVAAGARVIGIDLLFTEPTPLDYAVTGALARAAERGVRIVLPVTTATDANGEATPLYPVPEVGLLVTLGHAHLRVDEDAVVRGLHLVEGGFPAFSARIASDAGPVTADSPLALASRDGTPERRDQFVAQGRWPREHYALLPRLHSPVERVSAGQLLRGEVAPDRVAGRAVLVGVDAAGLGDRYTNGAIGRGELSSGVEIHAAAVSALRSDSLIALSTPAAQGALTATLTLLAMVALYRLTPRAGLVATAVLAAASLAVAAVGLRLGYWWSPTGALLGVVSAYPLWSWRRLEVVTAGLADQARALETVSVWSGVRHEGPLSSEPVTRSVELLRRAAADSLSLRRFLQMTLQHLPHPAFVVDARGRLVFGNERLASAFGQMPATGAAMTQWLADHEGPDPGPIDEAPRSHHEGRDARGRDWLVDSARFEDPDWRTATLVQLVDISPIRQAQREREQTLRFLSHDLRSPAISILSIVDRVRRAGEDDATASPVWLADVQAQATRSLELANGFVQLARAEAQSIAPEPLDLGALVTEAADMCWQLATARAMPVTIAGSVEDATVSGDAQLLRRALINLIDNAIKYGKPGTPVAVAITPTPAVGGDGRAAGWAVSVTDSGEGLNDEEAARVFDPYWRSPRRTEDGGAGLGLTFVRLVAERHGGAVSAGNTTPRGARFELWLPAT